MFPQKRTPLVWVLLAVAAAFLIAAILLLSRGPAPELQPSPTPIPTPTAAPVPTGAPEPRPAETPTPDEVDGLPVGKWVVTPERKKYVGESLTLRLPAIDVTRVVYDGTDAATLHKGVGLYEYAQLPGEGNRNVSMAGHRNGLDKNGNITDQAPFYYVDLLKEGDYLYLTDSGHIYRYLYEDTWVVEADDWGPIATTGYSCMTLTSCTPLGVADHRIIIRALLDEIFDYSDDFDYLSHVPEETEEAPHET